ncbi:MAG: phosphoadenosine phosphosulfate reductase family protein [bacterium]|nr:phosphoadenosine phosphosulfate reductase family protein [bacterium]
MERKTANAIEPWQLAQRQSLPLSAKVRLTEHRIRDWHSHWRGMVYVAFSGGKDSTVLLHIVRRLYPNVPAVFCDTGLEFPEIREFVKTIDNVTWLKPKMNFREVLEKYGYPVVSKKQAQFIREVQTAYAKGNTDTPTVRLRLTGTNGNGYVSPRSKISNQWQKLCRAPFKVSDKCCDVMKKRPIDAYRARSSREPFVGTMASDSMIRKRNYLESGCNSFDTKRPKSTPLAFWLESDVWDYIHKHNVPYSPIYDMGYPRTGCVFCAFGAHLEPSPNRFQRMQKTHPALWRYCMDKLGMREVLEFCRIPIEDKQLTLPL